MKKITQFSLCILFFVFGLSQINSQTSTSSNLVVQPTADRSIFYNVSDTGVSKPIIWGLDLAWLSESNIKRGIAFMGAEHIDLVRSSFTPTSALVNGELQTAELNTLNERLDILDLLPNIDVALNCDHPSVDPYFKGNAVNWAKLIEVTARYHVDRGHNIVSVAPFNEPDYTATGQGTISDFYNIAGELKANSYFDNIRISGGNTLNTDQALVWYTPLKDRLDEGNTHQLAGSFNNYVSFYETVKANGDHCTNDELHNVMEAMVGVEYGLQTGIWWGTAELARGEFVYASDGVRLGYAEHRNNWTAAAVYRNPDGKVEAFGGTSERQAVTTTYRFISKDKNVYYDGHGPQREYTMVLPGGNGYQNGQTNAENVVNITWGDDIQPVIDGRYILVNRSSGKVMEVENGSINAGANLRQGTNIGANYQQWNVTPVSSRVGGDFSYFTFTAVNSGKSPDILNFSLDNGGNIIVWDDVKSGNQQWYLDYAEDGWFYIRSRHSAKCMQASGTNNIFQWEKTNNTNQQWRFLPVDSPVEFNAPNPPTNLVATGNSESITLNWNANTESDLSGYTVFRSETAGGIYSTIARNVTTTSFVDNTTTMGGEYFYKIKAVDYSLNSSSYSNEVSATANEANTLLAHFEFEQNILDTSINLNHLASSGTISYQTGEIGSESITFNGSNTFLQLPPDIANQEEITVATWVYWNGGNIWQRIFDFGNSQNEYMFMTPSSESGNLRFAINRGAGEETLNASNPLPTNQWSHVALTIGASSVSLYVNGELVDESNSILARPIDFKPILNYIGKSQFSDPLLNARLDDFRIYNYALNAQDIAKLYNKESLSIENCKNNCVNGLSLWPIPANDVLHFNFKNNNSLLTSIDIFDINGRLLLNENFINSNEGKFDVSILPSGLYIIKLNQGVQSITKKLLIKH